MTDTLDTEQSELRGRLIAKGWKRDGRCKKKETYKQTFGHTVIKFEFGYFYVVVAMFNERKRWWGLHHFRYNMANRDLDSIHESLEENYGTPYSGQTVIESKIPVDERETRQDRQEREEYFRRLGI